ncbi:hypothetical protein ISS85_04565 [Candidatus Microgenomates bacterium]|nr:hypothetical protein [Candidatus Microgenomates bacterium]
MVRFHPAPHLMKKLINEVLKVNKKFPQAMSKEGRFIDLVEEVGELANAILVTEKHKSKKCMRAEIADSFADILYDLIVLADLYELDLEEEIKAMLKRLEKRIKKKEFEL